ncbi:CidA/LrgA family holin-like protein [Bacillus sp. CGMCC 1.16541]|uniref:CidA/LrgA family protein n=1 Tax=Bacillus sp. CGMCC 1.16541 TaxID=2185143 RepID=UPI000D7329C7|nr:CidA/LrgA family holin-like protein [Bacillus sp. CGMCC 1.16541]
MRFLTIVIQVVGLYILYKVGVVIQAYMDVPIPGSIIGMLLLFLMLQINIVKEKWLLKGSTWLLSHLALLFVPATVGIIQYVDYFMGIGFVSILVVIVSTLLVLIVTGAVSQFIINKQEQQSEPKQKQGVTL